MSLYLTITFIRREECTKKNKDVFKLRKLNSLQFDTPRDLLKNNPMS